MKQLTCIAIDDEPIALEITSRKFAPIRFLWLQWENGQSTIRGTVPPYPSTPKMLLGDPAICQHAFTNWTLTYNKCFIRLLARINAVLFLYGFLWKPILIDEIFDKGAFLAELR